MHDDNQIINCVLYNNLHWEFMIERLNLSRAAQYQVCFKCGNDENEKSFESWCHGLGH